MYRRECDNCGRVTANANETICIACGHVTREVETPKRQFTKRVVEKSDGDASVKIGEQEIPQGE